MAMESFAILFRMPRGLPRGGFTCNAGAWGSDPHAPATSRNRFSTRMFHFIPFPNSAGWGGREFVGRTPAGTSSMVRVGLSTTREARRLLIFSATKFDSCPATREERRS
jgi:hypothetical protein